MLLRALAVLAVLRTGSCSTCADWLQPRNIQEHPRWPYCNRRPGDGQTSYSYMVNKLPPANQAPYQCSEGRVLRHDAAGLLCADYSKGDDYAGPCLEETCCTRGVCSAYTCPDGWTKRPDHDAISCYFGCDEHICCDPDVAVPKQDAQGLVFVDQDPGRFVFGGKGKIIRAADESDITHYRIYWAFMKVVRKAPSCDVTNPVSWNTEKAIDRTKLFGEYAKTGCDIEVTIPMGTKAESYQRCPISYDHLERTVAVTDECNPHYMMVVAVNGNGEKPVARENAEQVGPRLAISDYVGDFGLPCAEDGVTGGHDLPATFKGANVEQVLGTWGQVETPAECARLCREYRGDKGPCRYWTWSHPTGGPSDKSCWMEIQTTQRSHYGVRMMGPAVCPTPNGTAPTGKERPRCERWFRHQNVAPFAQAQAWNGWDSGKTANFVQPPRLPDNPLGPYDSAEQCQAVCDQDVLCIGFVWLKRKVVDFRWRKCWLVRVETGVRATNTNYDLWMCSRENMAPLINGYELQALPFGYHSCNDNALIQKSASDNYDCCASQCDDDANCKFFTYSADLTCATYSACSKDRQEKVEGCAYESCYAGYGAATYAKDLQRQIQIIDTFPYLGTQESGIQVRIQSNGLLDGEEVTCIATMPDTPMPETAEGMKGGDFNRTLKTATITNDVAALTLTSHKTGGLEAGRLYMARCALTNQEALGAAPYVEAEYHLAAPEGYAVLGNGWCRQEGGCGTRKDNWLTAEAPSTLADCVKFCSAEPTCQAVALRQATLECILYSGCAFDIAPQVGESVYCLGKRPNPLTQAETSYVGGGECAAKCDGTCHWPRKMGQYERNHFTDSHSVACRGGSGSFAAAGAMPSIALLAAALLALCSL